MALRSSLFWVAAAVSLAVSDLASAKLIHYVFDPATTACYRTGSNPCDQSVSFSGSFTFDTDPGLPDPILPGQEYFPQVNITISNLTGDVLPGPKTLLGAFLPFEGDFLNFIAFDPIAADP